MLIVELNKNLVVVAVLTVLTVYLRHTNNILIYFNCSFVKTYSMKKNKLIKLKKQAIIYNSVYKGLPDKVQYTFINLST